MIMTISKFNDVTFNQDDSCFSVATDDGFKIFNTFPLQIKLIQHFEDYDDKAKGIGKTRMLNRSNYIALVGGGKEPRYPLNRLIIWDDLVGKESIKLNFMSAVRQVYISRCFIVVILDSKISLYSFGKTPKRLMDDIDIPSGSFVDYKSTNSHDDNSSNGILCYESNKYRGQIHVMNLDKIRKNDKQDRILPTMIIKAHKSDIQMIKLNHQGTMLATCSKKGTLIRVMNVQNGTLINEFRRGIENAEIYDMEFSPRGSKLAVISNKQTLHVFELFNEKIFSNKRRNSNGKSNVSIESENVYNKRLQNLNSMIPKKWSIQYLDSVWSMCSIHLKNPLLNNSQTSSVNHNGYDRQFEQDRCKIGWCHATDANDDNRGSDRDNNEVDNSEDSLVLIWKNSGIWEKYVILEKAVSIGRSGNERNPDGDVKYFSVGESLGQHGTNRDNTKTHKRRWEIVRESWREL
ncbi:similar to Saccharomyces cerevisiae YGR223C HSV2 Phosphatidylinositol 3,5-bisphosphate-binding protein, plays a role in micronucleophagy [Maudiozyma saulgeensis]|uniref:Similar to Saccharomyces cerevisiae YGR223C HSV2 Phosphatidylinositol 3,5-bisphosphate-binding protein, plays a role in micronucleophagy n=1 Tax=Maudiozyma saulgeensis TaxID=1789683 RepID=A0A1X7R9L1_9SACH|nr:similar to Saccharomyces cerevisiae YGR223C HSV2 Phosphatidylinositol 3,5-bisphosphate-binding protein, plays a role in micronucleophagy [Kazachstania saulgeensis]